MRVTTALYGLRAAEYAGWRYQTIEWSPRIAELKDSFENAATHFVLPNLPSIQTEEERLQYFESTKPTKRIVTIAASLHTKETLLATASEIHTDKILLVGGNSRSTETLSTLEAARILQDSSNSAGAEIWGVANPNDSTSRNNVEDKIDAGITGFITQPLLSSKALATLESYPRDTLGTRYLAGLAIPKTAKHLQFWLKLLNQPELRDDPLFRSHLSFFSQPYVTPLVWAGRELQDLATRDSIDGVHFMPLQNTDILAALLNCNDGGRNGSSDDT